MRRYHWKVTLLTLGVLLGFGSAIARFGFGYPLGPGCHGGWHEGHHGHYGHHHHHCDCEGDEPAPSAPGGVQSGKQS
jgi:hypothetical protein